MGAYLVGSFALGCADEWSDVDVVVVVRESPTPEQRAALDDLHTRLPDSPGPWAQYLEVSYATLADLRSPMTLGRAWLYVDNGARSIVSSAHDNTAHTRWVLRERGVVLAGPPAADLVAPMPPEVLRAEALGVARERAEALEETPALYDDAWFQPHAVLSACRMLFTAAHGTVAGKPDAAAWALGHHDGVRAAYVDLVRAALADRPDPWARVGRPADPDRARRTRSLTWDAVRWTGELALDARS